MPRTDLSANQLWVGKPFDNRNNSLNLIRLLLALTVLVHHSWPLTGSDYEPGFAGETLGGWAIAGFFVISGYLITASRWSNSLGDYLVHRVARIMPAFVVCLVVVAFVFAPIGYAAAKGNLDGFFGTATTPANYVFANLGLKMNAYDVAGSPFNVPYPGAWNGSLWSLYYEFLCYILVAFVGVFAFFRKSPWFMTAAFVLSVAVEANIESVLPYLQDNFDFRLLFQLLPFFLGGAVVQVWKDRIGIHWLPAVLSIGAAVLITALVPEWGGAASAVFICYGILWISLWLPSPAIIKKNDVSYGLYIYAFPVQQLLAVYGVDQLGILPFTLIATLCSFPLAAASWILVERPVMRAVRGRRKTVHPKEGTGQAEKRDPETADR
ncbi:acyltransferase family protein [Arthrobacter sp. 7Tela_A1]|uniref:acyltransferase family protein n=1 Tax=Arthrobacter sp. 7Tela_A1 TaxID=3093745 RepID=UPI003BB5AA76